MPWALECSGTSIRYEVPPDNLSRLKFLRAEASGKVDMPALGAPHRSGSTLVATLVELAGAVLLLAGFAPKPLRPDLAAPFAFETILCTISK
jgi:uncharacterized membrane protein YphA (DoxX/SURF4 family)